MDTLDTIFSSTGTSIAINVDGAVIDSSVIGGTTPAAGSFTTLSATGALDLDGAIQLDATLTVGVDDTGYDVKFFGDTASAYMLWDTSADDLILAGASGLTVAGTSGLAVTTATSLTVDDVAIDGKVITMTGSSGDTAVFTAGTNGTLAITTTDTAAAAANITLTADGTFEAVGTTITLDSGGAINLEPASGSAILLDGTISVDAGVVTGATSITSTAFVGDITGDVTGDVTGDLTGDVTGNADTATALETARTIGGTSFDGTANIVPVTVTVADTTDTSSYVALFESATGDLGPKTDAAITYNAGTGALTATSFVGDITGDVTGNADTATKIASITNSNIVQLTETQTLTNKTLTSPTLTTPALGTPASGVMTNVSGTAASLTAGAATALATARTIAGVSFDGTANISVPITGLSDVYGSMSPSDGQVLTYDTTNGWQSESPTTGDITGVTAGTNLNGGGTSGTVTLNLDTTITGLTSVTSTDFVGDLTGDVTGDVTGDLTGTILTAAQANITSLGTLTTLSVDNITINGNDISSTAGTDLTITPLTGQQIVLDGTIVVDAGVVTGATSITSTAFVGDLTGDVSGSSGSTTGNAATATALATARTIGGTSFDGTANIVPGTITVADTTDTTSYVALFESATGDLAPKTDAAVTYNAGTGALTATSFVGALTGNVTGNVTGSSGSTTGNAATVTNGVYTTNNLSVMAATTSAQLAGVISNETGSGSLVFATSPTLVTPALGTPASGTLTNCTFPTLNQNTTGTAATVTGAAQASITSLGTLTTLTVDNVIINGTTIGHTSDTDLMTLADGALTVAGTADVTNFTVASAQGTDGQVLTSTGSGVGWEDAGGGGASSINDLSDALVENNSIWLGNDPSGTTSTASESVALGTTALDAITTGDYNTAIGYNSLTATTTGEYCTAVGWKALEDHTDTGNLNAFGAQALANNTTGTNNCAFGSNSLITNTTGSSNTAFGGNTLRYNTTASNNTTVGFSALTANTTGANNTAVGSGALDANTTAADNTAVGYGALGANTTGASNTAVGTYALDGNTTASYNTAMGLNALGAANTGGGIVAIGAGALDANTSGADSVGIGYNALGVNTTGASNVAVGAYSLDANTTGAYNTAVGRGALTANTTAQGNTAVGYVALTANTTGHSNVAVGNNALDSATTAEGNTAVGYAALAATITGWQNTAVGHAALDVCTSSTNAAMGYNALGNATTSGGNVALGPSTGLTLTTGAGCNTILGAQSDTSASDSTHQIVLGYTIDGVADSTVTIGSASGTASLSLDGSDTSWAAASDERLKENITTSTAGLSFINDLRPITFNWKKAGEVPEDMSQYIEGSEEPCLGPEYGTTQHGFVAQEVKTAIDNHPELKKGFKMWQEYDNGTQSIAEGNVVNILVKAVQELSAEVEALKSKLEE